MKLLIPLVAILLGFVECKHNEYMVLEGHKEKESYSSPLPYTYISEDDLPASFTWENVGGRSYVTHSLNQHIPQYCGSCWAHGALSALGDRLKVAQSGQKAEELNLSVQYILNCAGKIAGSCHGGSHTGVYEFIQQNGFIPYDTCQVYVACSSESKDGFCPNANFECTPINTCRTCDHSGNCYAVDVFPNATVAEYGTYSLMKDFGRVTTKVKAEIYARGPVAAVVNAEPLLNYQGGIVTDSKIWHMMVNHVVSIVGWGTDSESGSQYWIVRNSWGQYWGELGYFRIIMGRNSLGIESGIAWATPGAFSVASKDNGMETFYYEDPSRKQAPLAKKLLRH